MELETTQMTQLLKWLEEERRKDKTQIATLQERLAGQANEIAEQTRRLQDLDNSLKTLQIALSKAQQTDRVLEEFKADILALLDRREDDRKKGEREAERLRMLEAESLQRQLTEHKKELLRIGKLEGEMASRRAEEKRLGELIQRMQPQLDGVTQQIEERTRGVPYLEEGRRQDSRRLAAVEQEIVNQLKKIDALFGKLQVLEDNLSKTWSRFDPILAHLVVHDTALEDLRVGDFHVQQQVATFEADMAKFRSQIIDYNDIAAKLREQSQINIRAEAQLKELEELLRQRAAELAETERLLEERVKRQLDEHQAEAEKRWSKQLSKWDEHWHEHSRTHR